MTDPEHQDLCDAVHDALGQLLAASRAAADGGLRVDLAVDVIERVGRQPITHAHVRVYQQIEPKPPEAPPRAFKCEHCEDGFRIIFDETPQHTCPKCGADIELPF